MKTIYLVSLQFNEATLCYTQEVQAFVEIAFLSQQELGICFIDKQNSFEF
jgi:hypothetical protein